MKQHFEITFPRIIETLRGYKLEATMLSCHHKGVPINEAFASSLLLSVDFEKGIAVSKNSIFYWEVKDGKG